MNFVRSFEITHTHTPIHTTKIEKAPFVTRIFNNEFHPLKSRPNNHGLSALFNVGKRLFYHFVIIIHARPI